jgi:hypothetical protein
MTGNPMLAADLFVGRAKQLSRLVNLLRQGKSTLVIGGRKAGKTRLVRQLGEDLIQRSLVRTDAAGWDLNTESSALGGLLSAIQGVPETTHVSATRDEITHALDGIRPLALVIDGADRILQTSWGPSFYTFLRWFDGTHLGTDISITLVGGPVLVLYKDPERCGSPPLTDADIVYLEALDAPAVGQLIEQGANTDPDSVLALGGGQVWLTSRMLAEVWEGATLDEAAETVFDQAVSTFHAWQDQLGTGGRALLRAFPTGGLRRAEMRQRPWSRHREACVFARCIGLLRYDGNHLHLGPQLFFDWWADRDPDELVWDVAISYATEDEPLARQIHAQMRNDFRVFFAPEMSVDLWGGDLIRVLPNTYGVQSRYVLVLSTPHYVAKYWTRIEYESVARTHPDRILLINMGELPPDRPRGLVYRGSSPGELVGLISALRKKLAG